ncbi:uncharacterized protein LOC114307276 [Camellia sinensis]|uniref:uncharacterized protein LOC114307276 n=1 Tax=Camellia sinensis TaxID=4442 RepID=UPI001035A27B|nr:uncharacterized protein LOC114307276 [Camellia sinensis]
MRETERFTPEQMPDYTIGWDAEGFRGEGDYTEYVRTYIMRPLSSGRRVEGERPAVLAARTGAGAGASRMARVRGRSGARRGRGASWPTLPTTMTCRGQGGKTYQIPIAPPLADHELVVFYDLPPLCFLRVHLSVPRADRLCDGDVPVEPRSVGHLRHSGPIPDSATGGAPTGPSVPVRGRDGRLEYFVLP